MLKRPPRDRVITTAMALFAAGLVALVVVVVLFVAGHRDLPAWLSASSVLMPIGFAIGAVHTVRQWRRAARSEEAQRADAELADAQQSDPQGADTP